jgi:hypothetical protein
MSDLRELGIDWFIYMDAEVSISKIQKEETGKIIISDFLKFLRLFQSI